MAASCTRRPAAPVRGSLRVAVLPHMAMAPVHLGVERGFFAAEGLAVTIESSALTREAIPILATGKVDVAMLSFSAALINAIVRGARIRLVAGRERITAGCGDGGALYARRARFPRGYDDAASWKGVRTATSSRTSVREYVFDRIAQHFGLPAGAIQVQSLRNEDAFAAAVSGRLDVITGGGRPGYRDDPLLQRLERIDLMERLLPNFQHSYVVFGPTILNAEPGLGGRFLRAYLKAARAFLAGETPQFFVQYAKDLGLDYGLVKSACRNTITPDGSLQLEDLRTLIDWCVRKKYIEKPVSVESVIDLRYLAAAGRALP
jgi:NitT/TauT family transport system substrate-binding protein